MISGLPFDDVRNLARQLPALDMAGAARVREAAERFARRSGSLGSLADVGAWLAASTGRVPRVLRPVVALFAGTHYAGEGAGVAEVQAFVDRTAAGGGAVNQACAAGDIGLKIFDLALDVPVDDIAAGAALDEKGCAATIAFGMEAVAGGTDLLVLAGFGGRAGRVSAEALLAALVPQPADAIAAPARRALEAHRGHLSDPLEALRRLGGRETAALAGAIVAARMEKVPVLLDGASALAAAAVVARLADGALAHCMVADAGGDALADSASIALGLRQLQFLGLDTQDGAAGALAANLAKSATLVLEGAEEFLRRG
ncbi:MAG: nicotinate-nucleotide--dimethylbenzimidazole phosphoribosyltransferase [Rhizobiaceae bacterium]|nr:nicotinate-nucleotide--dimethylbenzimidazole phosphoribosyltransferase [Rhizobiaceae bacterium]